MNNILLVFTGGTIGSQVAEGSIAPDDSAGFRLLRLFGEQYPHAASVSFKSVRPMQILSENLHPQCWTDMVAAIEKEDLKEFDGIIMTHGTDTLAFSAAMLGLYFNWLNMPLLLVSSDLPLENPLANGMANFICAVEFIRQTRLAGVFVPYRNSGQIMQIHIATRLATCLQLGSHFIGVQAKAFMRYEGDAFVLQTPINGQNAVLRLQANFTTEVLLIRPYPGLDYSRFDLEGTDVVLHELFHSGTACTTNTTGKNHSLIEFIERCNKQRLAIYLAPALKQEHLYSTTGALLEHGAQVIWNMSLETSYAKLLLAYGNFQTSRAIEQFLKQDIAWEHI